MGKTIQKLPAVLTAALILLVFTGCFLGGPSGEGVLKLQLGGSARSIWNPDTDLSISAYKIVFDGPGSREYTVHHQSGELVMDALAAGDWIITIEGYNGWDAGNNTVAGEQIAYLEKNAKGNRELEVFMQRGAVIEKTATLVPVAHGKGDLGITVDWGDIRDFEGAKLIYENPKLTVNIRSINEYFDRYDNHSGTDAVDLTITVDNEDPEPKAAKNLINTVLQEVAVTDAQSKAVMLLEGLPVGWYEITAKLSSTNDTYEEYDENNLRRYWQRMSYARIVNDPKEGENIITSGSFIIDSNTMFEVGSSDITIEDLMDPIAVSFTAPAGDTHTLNDPEDEGGTVTVTFTLNIADGDTYLWYLDGTIQAGKAAQSESFTFTNTGKYTVTASVIKEGNWGSVSMEITIDE